jgi:hypothetical protein
MVVFVIVLLLTSRVGATTPLELLAATSFALAWQLVKPDFHAFARRCFC